MNDSLDINLSLIKTAFERYWKDNSRVIFDVNLSPRYEAEWSIFKGYLLEVAKERAAKKGKNAKT